MRFVVPLLLMIGVAMPSAGHAKAATSTPKATRTARAPRPLAHPSQLLGPAWVAPASGGLMAAAMAGIAMANVGSNTSGGTPPGTSSAPTISPE